MFCFCWNTKLPKLYVQVCLLYTSAKKMYDEELTFNTDQWNADWYANMDGDGESSNAAIAYMGCPWFTYWCLSDTWKNNTILVPTANKCYWGGTGQMCIRDSHGTCMQITATEDTYSFLSCTG